MKSTIARARLLLLAFTLMMPVLSIVLTNTVHAAAPSFNFYGQVGQTNTTNYLENAGLGTNANGLANPFAVDIDTVLHHLFVVDKENNRVLFYYLNNDNELVDKTPDYVIGQPNMTTNQANQDGAPSASTLYSPSDVQVDESTGNFYVSDTSNNRVLYYEIAYMADGMSASHVLGQENFTTTSFNSLSSETLRYPYALALDTNNNKLFVGNSPGRVSIFDSSAISDNQNAEAIHGTTDPSEDQHNCSGAPDNSTFCGVTNDGTNSIGGLAYDNTNDRLYISDSGNYRILVFTDDGVTVPDDAVNVLGQTNFTSRDCCSFNDTTLTDPRSLAVDPVSQFLYVSDAGINSASRVMIFDVDPTVEGGFVDGHAAQNELGQLDFNGNGLNRNNNNWQSHVAANTLASPYGVAYNNDTGKLLVADSWNNRVVTYDAAPYTDGEDAIEFLGQSSFMTGGSNSDNPNANGLNFNAVTAIDTVHHRLFEADYENERVLVFNLDENNLLVDETADHVLGAPSMTSINWNNCSFLTDASLCFGEGIFGGLAYDPIGDHLYVTSGEDSRILVFDTTEIVDGESAVGLIGQSDYDDDSGCNRSGSVADNTLCLPGNLALDPTLHRLFVADMANSRVLMYELDGDNMSVDDVADAVIGQPDFDTEGCNTDGLATGLCAPNGIAFDTTNLRLYVADTSNNRITSYDLANRDGDNVITGLKDNGDITGTANDMVLGQATTDDDNSCNRNDGPAANTLCYPEGVHVDSSNHRLYVADTSNSRVLGYQLSASGDYLNTFANGQDADMVLGQDDMASIDCNKNQDSPDETTLCYPWGVTFDSTSGMLYVADTNNNRLMIFGSNDDNDGSSADVENGGPNGGDANNDGTPDSEQANVTSYEDAVTGKYAVVQTDCTANSGVQIGSEAGDGHQDSAYDYPAGLVDFYATGCGSDVTVTQYYYGSFDASKMILRKWHNGVYTTVTDAVLTNVNIGGQPALKIVYHVIDGGPFDDDGTFNGQIHDPAGPALSVVAAPNTGLGGSK